MSEFTKEGFPLEDYWRGGVLEAQRFTYGFEEQMTRVTLPILSSVSRPARVGDVPVVGAVILAVEYGISLPFSWYLDFSFTDKADELGQIPVPPGSVPEFLAGKFNDFPGDPIEA